MKTPDLKPCPFCGGEPLLWMKDNEWSVCCNECSAEAKKHRPANVYPWAAYEAIQDAVRKAIEAWNRRVNDADAT